MEVMMSKDTVRMLAAVVCAVVCVTCPLLIGWLSQTYGFDLLRSDADYRSWRGEAVDALFWVAALSTVGFIALTGRCWWLATLVSLPLLCLTGVLAVTGRMWIDGTYF
jgi:hypothetical protein